MKDEQWKQQKIDLMKKCTTYKEGSIIHLFLILLIINSFFIITVAKFNLTHAVLKLQYSGISMSKLLQRTDDSGL